MRRTISTNGGAFRIWKPNRNAHLAVDALSDFQRAPRLWHVHSYRLLAIHMLAARGQHVHMLDVKEGRRRNLYGIDVWIRSHRLIRIMAVKRQPGIDAADKLRDALTASKCVLPFANWSGKMSPSATMRASVFLGKRCGHRSAALAAAKQSVAHGRICRITKGGARLHKQQSAGTRATL